MIDVIRLFVQEDQVLLTNNECKYTLLVIKAFLKNVSCRAIYSILDE